MTSATARYLYVLVIALSMMMTGCRPARGAPVRVVDLLRDLDRAEQRPAGQFTLETRAANEIRRPSIVAPVPSRVTWSAPLPRDGVFRAFVAIDPGSDRASAVRFRLGVSDDRTYEGLAEHIVTAESAGWTTIEANLAAYAGVKWSLFYRPDRITWRIVLAADHVAGSPAHAIWGAPEVLTDNRSAREYYARRQALASAIEP